MSELSNKENGAAETSRELVPLVRESNPLDALRQPSRYQLTNLSMQDEWSQAVAIRCLSEADDDLAKMSGSITQVEHYMAHIVPVVIAQTGEVENRARVVLVDPAGRTFAWTSPITTRYWGQILAAKGQGPWDPPLRLKVVKHPGKLQGFWYSLELELPARPVKGKVVHAAQAKPK